VDNVNLPADVASPEGNLLAMGRKLSPAEMEIYRRTDEILHFIWDPIGITGAAGARDEYHSYLPVVFSKLQQSSDASTAIVDYLVWVEEDRMGAKPNRQHAERVAELLIENRDWVDKNPDRWPPVGRSND